MTSVEGSLQGLKNNDFDAFLGFSNGIKDKKTIDT
jgi:hypothetical protein